MEEILEKNLSAMDKWYPQFAEIIRKKDYKADNLEIIEEYSYDEYLIYRIKIKDRLLYLNGKRNVEDLNKLWIQRLGDIHEYATVILIGLGSAIYLKELIANTNENVNVVVYEPSISIFINTISNVDLTKEIENRPIAFVVEGLNGGEFTPIIEKLITESNLDFLKVEVHPNYQEFEAEKVLYAMRSINRQTDLILANVNTGAKFADVMAVNQFLNMEYICDGYNTRTLSQMIPREYPAILVAAGPSLNEDIEELRRAKGRAFLLAVDTAIKPLIKAGIKPDAFITIDAKKMLTLVDTDEIRDTAVIAPITASNEILRRQRGKKIFYYDGYILPWLTYLAINKMMPDVSSGGSVATSGFSLLYKMGFNEIILVGQDLAYTNNKSHADGTFENVMPEEDTSNMIKVKGNSGDLVRTRTDFKLYIDWYSEYIVGAKEYRKKAHNEELRVINTTLRGAYLEGTEIKSLKEVIDNFQMDKYDFEDAISKMQSDFSMDEHKKLIEYVHSIPNEFGKIRESARRLTNVYKKLKNICTGKKFDKDAYLKHMKKAKKLQKECENNPMYQIVVATIPTADYIVKSEGLYFGDNNLSEGRVIAEQGMKFCEMIQECSDILQKYAEQTLLTIK